jgi:hypothetical protein
LRLVTNFPPQRLLSLGMRAVEVASACGRRESVDVSALDGAGQSDEEIQDIVMTANLTRRK